MTLETGVLRRKAALALLTLVSILGVSGQTSDTKGPDLLGITVDRTTVDVSSGPQVVVFTLPVQDDLSGINYAYVYLRSPSWAQSVSAYGWGPNPSVLATTLVVNATIPRYAEAGDWIVEWVFVYDKVGNSTRFDRTALTAKSWPTTVTVADTNPDLTAPIITGLRMTPSPADVTSWPVTVQVEMDVTDSLAGVNHSTYSMNDFRLLSPSGKQDRPIQGSSFTLVAGTLFAGTWRATFVMPQFSEAGIWQVGNVTLRDMVGNTRFYNTSALTGLGLPVSLAVTSPVQDTTVPAVTGVRLIPSFVNTSTGPQTIRVEVDATDDLTGVDMGPDQPNISYYQGPFYRSPSGVQYIGASPWSWSMTGTSTNGTWTNQFTLPQYSEEGDWAAQQFRLKDVTRNILILERASMQALGLPTTFQVIKPTLSKDGTIGNPATGGTITDTVFGERASVTFPPGVLSQPTDVAIDVLQSPLSVPLPTGFSGAETLFVNIHLTPEPAYPLAAPGLTVVLPLKMQMVQGTALYLYRVNPGTGALEPAISTSGYPVVGFVNAGGDTATFSGISRLSTVVGLLSGPIELGVDIKPEDAQNAINTKANGVFAVAIYSLPTLDATKIDLAGLRLAGASVASNKQGKYLADEIDMNGDGFKDLLVHFDTATLQLPAGATQARLDGETLDHRVIWGRDVVRVVK